MCNEFKLGFTNLGNRHGNLILDLVHICTHRKVEVIKANGERLRLASYE
jgi:hypothetical protein